MNITRNILKTVKQTVNEWIARPHQSTRSFYLFTDTYSLPSTIKITGRSRLLFGGRKQTYLRKILVTSLGYPALPGMIQNRY